MGQGDDVTAAVRSRQAAIEFAVAACLQQVASKRLEQGFAPVAVRWREPKAKGLAWRCVLENLFDLWQSCLRGLVSKVESFVYRIRSECKLFQRVAGEGGH